MAITPTSNPELFVNGGKTQTAGQSLNQDFTFFLKMLTTQLQNQDPTEPMDVSQMTQQIAQYSGVEQQIRTNTLLESLMSSNKQSQLSTAVSYIGKEVETSGSTGTLQYAQSGDKVYGQAVFSYVLPADAASAKITILNASGQAVFTGDGTLKNGRNVVVWDGKNSFTGDAMAAGKYTIQVAAKNAKGEAVTVDTRSVGVVDTVETDENGDIILTVGEVRVKYADVLAVRDATPFYVSDSGDSEGEDGTATGGDDTVGGGSDTGGDDDTATDDTEES